MQSLIAPPRDSFTIDAVTALLQAPDFHMVPGADLLDDTDTFVDDISGYLSEDGSSVSRDCNALLHGSCQLNLSTELRWGHDRVRPYVQCGSPELGLSGVRFNLGVYIATSPSGVLGENPAKFSVTGYDKLFLLAQPIGDSVIAGQGADVLLTITQFIQAAVGEAAKIALDQAMAGALLASDIVWPIAASNPATYLDVVNDLLDAINYIPLYVDQDGFYTSRPYLDPQIATPEWIFSVQDKFRNIIADPRQVTRDTWGVPNWWRFVQNGLSVAPVEGAGQYTYIDTDDSPLTSFAARGYYVRKFGFLDAVDQGTLVGLSQQQINSDRIVPESWSLPSGPLPQSGHFDIVEYIDKDIDGGVTSRKCQVQTWTLNLDGSEMARNMNTVLVLPV